MKRHVFSAVFALCAAMLAAQGTGDPIGRGGATACTKTTYDVTSRFGEYWRRASGTETRRARDGRLYEIVTYTQDGSAHSAVETFYYDAGGALESTITVYTPADGAGGDEYEVDKAYEYDADGRVTSITETLFETGELRTKTMYRYDGNVRTESVYDANGALASRTFRITDENTHLTLEDAVYNGDGTLAYRRDYTYTADGKIRTADDYDAEGVRTHGVLWIYDENGFIAEERVFTGDDITGRRIYKTDSFGNPLRISYYSVAEKFGGLGHELFRMDEFEYTF